MGFTAIDEDGVSALLAKGVSGPVTMLNLLRFRETADYSHAPHLAPDSPITGAEAYRLYMAATRPMIERSGARVSFIGKPVGTIIGPPDEAWDFMLLVEYPSVDSFLAHTGSSDTRETIHHRQAALADSRLIPVITGRPD